MTSLRHIILDFAQTIETDPQYARFLDFTPLPPANDLILANPNAFLIGAISDQQVRQEIAWNLPYSLRERLGHLSPQKISRLDVDLLYETLIAPPALHRHCYRIADYLIESCKHLCDSYGGDASRIWSDSPAAVELQSRLLKFKGVNQKISAMIISLLVSRFQVPIREIQDSELAVDRHVQRVLFRTGASNGELDDTILAGKRLCPESPGRIDFALYWIGKLFCHSANPDCADCPLSLTCLKRVKPSLVAGLSEIQKTKRIVEKAAQKQIRFLERLERQLHRLTVKETQEGKIHQMCAYHGVNCPHMGEKYHPIRYIRRTKERTFHVRKREVATVFRQLENRKREQSLQPAYEACQSLRQIVAEGQKFFEEVEQIYDENL